ARSVANTNSLSIAPVAAKLSPLVWFGTEQRWTVFCSVGYIGAGERSSRSPEQGPFMHRDADHVARGGRGIRRGRGFMLAGGRRGAVVFNIAYEAWSDGKASGLGPMGNPLPSGVFDTNALSWRCYGATRGIERLLRVLEQVKLQASIMVSGVFADRTPA